MIEKTVIYEIKLPIIKVSLNKYYEGTHFSIRKKHKDNYVVLTNGFKSYKPIDCKVDIDMDFYYKTRALDSSNNAGMFKLIEDCIVKHGILKDDNINFVGRVAMESHKDKTASEDYVVITIKKAGD